MQITSLINSDIPSLRVTDPVWKALDLMEDAQLKVLPVLENQVYLGTLDENFLLNFDQNSLVGSLPFKNQEMVISENVPITQLVDYLLEKDLEVVVVTDEQKNYVGTISAFNAFKALATEFYSGNGAVVLLHLGTKDYSLSEISRITESEGVQIQKLFLANTQTENGHALMVKFNKEDVSAAISSLKRFGYKVESLQQDSDVSLLEKERYQLLMKYLEV